MLSTVVNSGVSSFGTGPALARMVGADQIRVRINGTLAEIHRQIINPNTPTNDFRVQSIDAWHRGFTRALRHPEPQKVIDAFVPELVGLLRNPADVNGLEPPFPPELFGPRAMPIIQYVVEKLRDPHSLLYSQEFDLEAVRVLAAQPTALQNEENEIDAGIPEELLAQLRQIEANNAQQEEVDAEGGQMVHALRGRIHQDEVSLQTDIDRVARHHFEACRDIQEETARLRLNDLNHRTQRLEAANLQRQEAVHFRAENVRLQDRLDRADKSLGELGKANIQLQKEINTTRAEIAENKSNWLTTAACVVASVALSWIFKTKIMIIPP